MGIESAGSIDEVEKNSFKAVNKMTDDRISELPEDILSFIISFLTIRDAIKARVLSPRWRYLFPSTVNLHLDLFTIFGITYDYTYLHKNLDKLCERKLRFVKAVDQVLQLYRISDICSLKVSCLLGDEFASYIDRWITFAVRKKTKKLDLSFSFVPQCEPNDCLDDVFIPQDCEPYNFSFHLLPQDKASQLKHLSLQACKLRFSPDFTNCLNSLNTLELNKVPLDQNVFDNILAGCLSLKWLTLKHCSLPAIFFIRGEHICLESLVLEHCRGGFTIKLSSIDVKTFECTSGSSFELNFVGVSSVKNLYIELMRGANDMFNGLSGDLPHLENLSLNLFTNQVPVAANLKKFSHLKILELIIVLSRDFDLLSVASILNASPCLQKFHLFIQGSMDYESVKWEYSKQLYYQLKEVEISGWFLERYNPLGLAIYLLNSAVGLERMTIDSRWRELIAAGRCRYVENPVMTEADKKRVLSILQNEKARPEVEVIII